MKFSRRDAIKTSLFGGLAALFCGRTEPEVEASSEPHSVDNHHSVVPESGSFSIHDKSPICCSGILKTSPVDLRWDSDKGAWVNR